MFRDDVALAPIAAVAELGGRRLKPPENMNPTRASSLPTRIGWGVAIVFIGAALLPFAVIGGTWGMVWFYITAPLSLAVEATFGIDGESCILIVLTSVACAVAWAAVAYALTRTIQRWNRAANARHE